LAIHLPLSQIAAEVDKALFVAESNGVVKPRQQVEPAGGKPDLFDEFSLGSHLGWLSGHIALACGNLEHHLVNSSTVLTHQNNLAGLKERHNRNGTGVANNIALKQRAIGRLELRPAEGNHVTGVQDCVA
jgi:hypothetical protein